MKEKLPQAVRLGANGDCTQAVVTCDLPRPDCDCAHGGPLWRAGTIRTVAAIGRDKGWKGIWQRTIRACTSITGTLVLCHAVPVVPHTNSATCRRLEGFPRLTAFHRLQQGAGLQAARLQSRSGLARVGLQPGERVSCLLSAL